MYQRMDDDLRRSPADLEQSMGPHCDILFLGRTSLRANACTDSRTTAVRGATSYVISDRRISVRRAVASQPRAPCNCPQCHFGWLDAGADFFSRSGESAHAQPRITRNKMGLRDLGLGWRGPSVDHWRTLRS